jgi:hypothetical protein
MRFPRDLSATILLLSSNDVLPTLHTTTGVGSLPAAQFLIAEPAG